MLDCIWLHSINGWGQVTFQSFCQEADSECEKFLDKRELCPEGPVPAEALLTNVSLWSLSPSGLTMASAIMVHRDEYNHCNNSGRPHQRSWRFKQGPWEQSQTESTCSTGVPCLCAPISAGFSADDQDRSEANHIQLVWLNQSRPQEFLNLY